MRALTAGKLLRASIDRLDEERHEAQADAVLLLERLLVAGAQVHDPRHVGFVEGGQDRGGLLGLDQALGDALAEAAHPLAGLAAGGRGTGILRGRRPWPDGVPPAERHASRCRGWRAGTVSTLSPAGAGASR